MTPKSPLSRQHVIGSPLLSLASRNTYTEGGRERASERERDRDGESAMEDITSADSDRVLSRFLLISGFSQGLISDCIYAYIYVYALHICLLF